MVARSLMVDDTRVGAVVDDARTLPELEEGTAPERKGIE